MSKNLQYNCNNKMLLVAISAALLVGSFVVGSQFVQPSMAQSLGQLGQEAKKEITGAAQDLGQLGQESEKEIAGAVGPLVGGNQTGNQTGNQSGGMLGQLGEQAKSMLPDQ
ncbi:MAG: hypothetical protein WBL67_22370 [Nitrososphaeraceae archaeon]